MSYIDPQKTFETARHFIRLASRGGHGAASGGERRCHAIATCLLENVNGIDDQALQGAKAFIDLVYISPEDARDLIH